MTFQASVLTTTIAYPDWVYSNVPPPPGLAAGANDGVVRVLKGNNTGNTVNIQGSTDQSIQTRKRGRVQGV